jgi:Protein of unknown function (DUF1194)
MRLVFIVVAMIAACCGPAAAQSDPPRVDVALVLTVDASGSIDPAEFQLQKEGIAGAITDPQVLGAIQSGRQGRIAIAYVEWGSPGAPKTGVDWMLVGNEASATAFAQAVLGAERSMQSYNAIGDAIVHNIDLLNACPCKPSRRIIDISGDNPDNRSVYPAPLARDTAVAAGITINALAILQDGRLGPAGKPWLIEAYEGTVIGGFGAFAIAANTRSDFARALRDKMVLEISGLFPGAAESLAEVPDSSPKWTMPAAQD